MHTRNLRADALLLLVAAIWGFAFVAQSLGMESLGPFGFNGIRFAVGVLSLLPLLWFVPPATGTEGGKKFWLGGFVAGLFLFMGSATQQIGLLWTTAGNAGFITGLYVVLVPLIGIFFAQRTGPWTWIGAVIAVVGLYLLSVGPDFSVNTGDIWVLVCAGFFAGHVLVIGHLAKSLDNLRLAVWQFVVCALLSLLVALVRELDTLTLENIRSTAWPILWAGVASVGVAYTLQIYAQKNAPASHAAIIMSLESVFAAIGGAWILGEVLDSRGLLGCGLMLAGMLASQVPLMRRPST
ncbi:MAG: DMT family transporter [Granulosicoccaceae bacterium]